MKVVCIKTGYWPDSYEYRDLSSYITKDKHYEVLPNSASKWVWNIIDDRGKPHDISKECFIELRNINLDKLLNKINELD